MADADTQLQTFTGNRGLQIEEALIFETGRNDVTGVDLPESPKVASRLGRHARTAPIDLPGLSEPEAMRHYVRLSQKNYAIDTGLYPLGSCTMKHNPRLNEKMARLAGFADIHPLQPLSTVPGALELIAELGRWLLDDDRHGVGGDEPEGRRPWRTLRHDGDQGGARPRAARSGRRCWCRNRRMAPTRRPRRSSAIAWSTCRPAATARSTRPRSASGSGRTSRRSC